MTHYISFRSGGTGRSLANPLLLTGDGAAAQPMLGPLQGAQLSQAVTSKHLLFGVHGYAVGYERGANIMAEMESRLALPSNVSFFGILWPGDSWLPYVNYPWEADDAVICGRRLAAICNGPFAGAASVSCVSHSLGARLALETAANLVGRKAHMLCLMAAAVDSNVLTDQYRTALDRAEHVFVLSSTKDLVLRAAYPIGDAVSDIFLGDRDSPFRSALGLGGPRPGAGPTVNDDPIRGEPGCGHLDYLPGGNRWAEIPPYVRRSFYNEVPVWPR